MAEDSLILTTGASIGLFLAATTFLPANDGQGVVFLECPSYFIASSVFENDLGLKVVTVPMDEDGSGPDIAKLRSAFQKYCAKGNTTDSSGSKKTFHLLHHSHVPQSTRDSVL